MRRAFAGVRIGLAGCALSVGCGAYRSAATASPRPAPPAASTPSTLPSLPVDVLAAPSRMQPSTNTAEREGRHITLSATNVDVRELLPAIASAAGVSMVMAPDVRGRVTLHFVDADARDVLRAVIEQAGLTVGAVGLIAPFPKPVFFDLPVNINAASAETIQARFGVSALMAEFITAVRAEPRN